MPIRMRPDILRAVAIAAALALAAEACASSTKRSTAERNRFQRETLCPSTGKPAGACPGYVIDHVVPLCAGGEDHRRNMQWLTVEQHRAKSRDELARCRPAGPGYHKRAE